MIHCIDHVNLVVQDLAGMKRFYQEVFGFVVTKEVCISGDWISAVVGLNDVVADVIYLDLPDGPRIELIKYQQPVGTIADHQSAANTFGIRHIAFRVTDIEAVSAAIEAAGVRLRCRITEVPTAQVSYGAGKRKRLLYFEDPEGNLLELCEYA